MDWLPNAAKIYRALLFAYPSEFRHEYGAELERLFEDRLHTQPRFGLWLETVADVTTSAAREHLNILAEDLRYCAVTLAKVPGFALAAILTIALGIGSTTAVFSIVDAMFNRSMPYRDAERLVNIYTPNSHFSTIPEVPPSNADFNDWRRLSHSFAQLTHWSFLDLGLAGDNGTVPVRAASVDRYFFPTLGVAPERGRTIDANDDSPGHEHVAVIGDDLWRGSFASDPNILGRTIRLGQQVYSVIGVMPERFRYPHSTDFALDVGGPSATAIWIPAALTPSQQSERVGRNKLALGRLRSDVPLRRVQTEMARIEASLATQYPPAFRGWSAEVKPLIETAIGPVRAMISLLSGAVLLVLLIACSNVAGLLVARAAAKEAELSVRAALGAGRMRLARLVLTEALVISLLGGIAGAGLAVAIVSLISRLNPGNIPGVADASPDSAVLLFAAGVSLFSCLLFGVVPGLSASRVDVAVFLKRNGRSIAGGAHRLRHALVVIEVALSIVLLVGAGLLLRSYMGLQSVDKGFDESAMIASLSLDRAVYRTPDSQSSFVRRLVDETRRMPGVSLAGAINIFPLNPNEPLCALSVKIRPQALDPPADCRSATPDYFRAAGVHLLRGRAFTESDDAAHPGVAVINQAFAMYWFGDADPLGQQVRFGGDAAPWATVIGVVADTRHSRLEELPRPAIYQPFWQEPRFTVDLVVKGRWHGDDAATLRGVLKRVDPAIPAMRIRTIGEIEAADNSRRRFQTALLTGFAGLAVFMALVGLYGLTSYTVRRRTAEIGIRMAMGGSRSRVAGRVIAQSLTLVVMGLVIGLAASPLLTRLLAASLYQVARFDPATYLIVCALTVLFAFVACLLPAWKAAAIDPMAALRCY